MIYKCNAWKENHKKDTNQGKRPKPKIKCTKAKNQERSIQHVPKIRKPNSKWEAHTKLSSQTSKGGLIQRFGKDIGYLVLGSNLAKLDIPFFLVVSQKVVSHIYVFGFGVEHRIFGNADGTRAVTKKSYSKKDQPKIVQSVSHPQELRATASSSNIFSFSRRLSNARLFAKRPRNKRRTKELTSSRSRLAIQTTSSKIGIGIATKR